MIAAAEKWLVEECGKLAGSVFKCVEAGPGDWSKAYLERVIEAAPAIVVVWEGGPARTSDSELTIESRWTVYVVTCWEGSRKNSREAGIRACELLAPVLHNSVARDPASRERLGLVRLTGVRNLWSQELDMAGAAVYGIGLEIPIPLDPGEEIDGRYDQFLRADIAWDLPGAGSESDAHDTVTLEGADT